VPGLSGVTQIDISGSDGYAVRSDGSLWAWGQNGLGELGNGTTASRFSPGPVPGLTGITQVSAAPGYVLARRSDGTVWAWGANSYGQLGDGTEVSRTSPEQLALTGVTQVAIGINAGAGAVRSDGTLLTWGCNAWGQLGNGNSHQFGLPPEPVRSLVGVTQVAFGGFIGAGYGLAIGSQAYATVPSLRGLTVAAAGQHLQAANLVLGTETTAVDNTCENIGRVMGQTPAAGTVLIGGSAVSVTVGVRPTHPCP
jgi:alpha-tubulin suppressor-like RCC1 family protein